MNSELKPNGSRIHRILTNICSDALTESRDFYVRLFDFRVAFDSDWFVNVISEDKQLEIGIIHRSSSIVPEAARGHPTGFVITFVVEDVEHVYQIAVSETMDIIEPPTTRFTGSSVCYSGILTD